jgi:GrpB-like predicted nucleotidyltransferase (UPF0157 family)
VVFATGLFNNMITKEQEKWISHLGEEKIKIIPYDPKTKIVFEKARQEVQEVLGNVNVAHHGATSLGISGQGEVDLFIPVDEKCFGYYLEKLIGYFGTPGSIYALERARFVKYIDDIKVEIMLVNREKDGWRNSVKFKNSLLENPNLLNEYRKLKENSNGLSLQKYYRRKTEFYNKIFEL